jgi:2,3-bisphosphoglycerate-independent phosphoglycerate mutase
MSSFFLYPFLPDLDALAAEGVTGLHCPVAPAITPGSGPGHLGLFGYDPLVYRVGRGVLAAAGIDFDLLEGDVAARGNFCTVADDGTIKDRRAGRISTEENERLCQQLQQFDPGGGIKLFVAPIKEHRFLLVLRGKNLSYAVSETDPQATDTPPFKAEALQPEARETAQRVNRFADQAREALKGEGTANMILLRGFAGKPDWPSFSSTFGLRAAASANYPMYCGLARLLGMDVLPKQEDLPSQIRLVKDRLQAYDFFFLHVKKTDSTGEDGDFDRKVQAIEAVDRCLPDLRALDPDVLIVTGDHSTPAVLHAHSWHPVPVVLWSKYCRPDLVERFGERACVTGALGPRFLATDLMPLALANARRLQKYGA